MDENKMRENARAINETCALYRGKVLHSMVFIEGLMEVIITEFYFKDAYKEELFNVLAQATDRLTFYSKFNIFRFLVKTHFKDIEDKYPDYLGELEKFIEIRNMFAHRKCVLDEQTIKNFDGVTIYLEWATSNKGKINMRTEPINLDLVSAYINRMNVIVTRTQEIMEKLIPRE